MALYVMSGPAQTGKLDRAIALQKAQDSMLVLCATAAQEGDIGRHYGLNMPGLNDSSHVALQGDGVARSEESHAVQSFAGFAASFWTRWGDGRDLVGAAIRARALEEAIEKTGKARKDLPELLCNISGRRLFLQLAPSYIPEAGIATKNQEKAAASYIQGIKAALDEYHFALSQDGFIEHQYAITLLAQGLSDGAIRQPAKTLIVVGFRDFSPAQLRFLAACAQQSDVYVVLDCDEGNPATNYLASTIRQLQSIGGMPLGDKKVAGQSPNSTPASKLSPAESMKQAKGLSWLGANFLAPIEELSNPPEELMKDRQLLLGKAQGKAAEVVLLSQLAQDSHEQYPNQPKALLVSNLESYIRPLTRELERRKVPFELDVKTPFGSTGFGSAFLSLLKICLDDEALQSGTNFSASAYSGLNSAQSLELNTEWRSKSSSNKQILFQLSQHDEAGAKCLGLIDGRKMEARIGDWYSLITQLFKRGTAAQAALGGQSGFDQMQESAAQKAATSALQELYELSFSARGPYSSDKQSHAPGEKPEDPAVGKRMLRYDPIVSARDIYSVLCDASVSQTPRPGSTSILISAPSRVYGRRFHTVIAGGLAASDDRGAHDPSLGARLAAHFSNTTVMDVGEHKTLEHYGIIAAARTRLCLVAQSETLGGEKIQPGDFLSAVEDSLGEDFCSELTVKMPHDETIAVLSYANEEKQKDLISLQRGIPVPQVQNPPHGIERSYDFGYKADTRVSPSELEKYAFCSYGWMIDGYAKSDEIERSFAAREQGNFAHKVLKAFYEALQESGLGNRLTGENWDDARQLYFEVFDAQGAELWGREKFSPAEVSDLDNLRAQLADFLHADVDYAPEFVPTYLEHKFGFEEDSPLDIGLGMPMRGIVDRIDVREDDGAAIVIDYKRKVSSGLLSTQAKNRVLQAVLYREAAEQVLGLRVVAHEYRDLLKPEDSKVAYSREDNPPERELGLAPLVSGRSEVSGLTQGTYEKHLNTIMSEARAAAAGLRAGEVSLREKSGNTCKYCSFEACPHWKSPGWK